MKALVFASLALVLSVLARPVAAQAEREHSEPAAISSAEASRPLLRFLIGSLQLPDQQALAVSRILQVEIGDHTPTADMLATALAPVLKPEQIAKFQSLAPSDELSSDLRYLATLH